MYTCSEAFQKITCFLSWNIVFREFLKEIELKSRVIRDSGLLINGSNNR